MSYLNTLLVLTAAVLLILAVDIILLSRKRKINWKASDVILLTPLALQLVLIPAFYLLSNGIPSCGQSGAICAHLGVFYLLFFWPASLVAALIEGFRLMRRERRRA